MIPHILISVSSSKLHHDYISFTSYDSMYVLASVSPISFSILKVNNSKSYLNTRFQYSSI